MSNKALNWVAQLDLKAKHAYPLMVIADGVNDFGDGFFSEAYLAWRLGNDARTVRRALKELREMGLVQSKVTFREDGSRGQSHIRLLMSDENLARFPKESWESVRARLWAEQRAKYLAYRQGEQGAPLREWGDDLPPASWLNTLAETVDNLHSGSAQVLPDNLSGSEAGQSLDAMFLGKTPESRGSGAEMSDSDSQVPPSHYRTICPRASKDP